MQPTPVWTVDAATPDPATIARAAALLQAGEVVAFPTETVYGLGANAFDAVAVERIFTAKGRPATNPVIVHTSNTAAAKALVTAWPEAAEKLAKAFWPGPLTLVLPKAASIPDIVTAGGPTVAVRVPNNMVALALLNAVGVPLAAPSANRSTELSPTKAEHVLQSLNGRIAAILDGGPCRVGLESTVLDVTGDTVRVLRPGMITVPMLEAVVGPVSSDKPETGVARSPGQMAKHYSPRTPMIIVKDGLEAMCVKAEYEDRGLEAVILDDRLRMTDPATFSMRLYDTLHDIDNEKPQAMIVVLPPETPAWAAIRDRLIHMPDAR